MASSAERHGASGACVDGRADSLLLQSRLDARQSGRSPPAPSAGLDEGGRAKAANERRQQKFSKTSGAAECAGQDCAARSLLRTARISGADDGQRAAHSAQRQLCSHHVAGEKRRVVFVFCFVYVFLILVPRMEM